MSDKQPICMTVRDVAEELQLSENHVRLLIRRGEIPCRRIGKAIRILRSDLLEYLRANVELEEKDGIGWACPTCFGELRKAEARQALASTRGAPDPKAECLAQLADRWRLNTIKR